MSRNLVGAILAAALMSSFGCGKNGPEADAQLHGYISVWETMGHGALVSLKNGRVETQLLLDENTELVDTLQRDGKTPMWYFDSVYQVDGRMNWAPEEYLDENGSLEIPRMAGSRDWVWATKIERLGERDSSALIESGVVIPKELDVDYDSLADCFERAEMTLETEDELEAERRSCLGRQGSSAGGEETK